MPLMPTARVAAALTFAVSALAGCSATSAPHPAPYAPPAPRALRPLPIDLDRGLPAATPETLVIPALRIAAPIVPTGLNPDDSPETPPMDHPEQVGWDTATAVPGTPGAAVIIGHLDTRTGTAVFVYLSALRRGDTVQVGRDDGTVATYTVDAVKDYPRTDLPSDVFTGTGRPALRLITCGGSFDRKAQHYSDNTVVYATLTSAQAPLTRVPHPAPINIPIPQPTPSPTPKPTPTPTPTKPTPKPAAKPAPASGTTPAPPKPTP